jgi:high-affinity K+ transport system ATPase subunit B
MTTQPISSHPPKKEAALRRKLYRRAVVDAFRKLNPRWMVRNP